MIGALSRSKALCGSLWCLRTISRHPLPYMAQNVHGNDTHAVKFKNSCNKTVVYSCVPDIHAATFQNRCNKSGHLQNCSRKSVLTDAHIPRGEWRRARHSPMVSARTHKHTLTGRDHNPPLTGSPRVEEEGDNHGNLSPTYLHGNVSPTYLHSNVPPTYLHGNVSPTYLERCHSLLEQHPQYSEYLVYKRTPPPPTQSLDASPPTPVRRRSGGGNPT
jgi:hypothetical protein